MHTCRNKILLLPVVSGRLCLLTVFQVHEIWLGSCGNQELEKVLEVNTKIEIN